MFLNRLTRPQRVAFMSLARAMATSDGISNLGEVTTLTRLGAEMGFLAGDDVEMLPVELAAERFDSRSARLIALYELMDLGYSDQSYSVMESGLVGRLGVVWGVGAADIAGVEQRVLRHRRFLDDTLEFFGAKSDRAR